MQSKMSFKSVYSIVPPLSVTVSMRIRSVYMSSSFKQRFSSSMLSRTKLNRNVSHSNNPTCCWFNIKHTTFNQIYRLVCELWKFKKLNLITSVSNNYDNAHWLLNELSVASITRGLWIRPDEMKKRKFNDHKMHRFRIFHCGLHFVVNPYKLIHKLCWIDALQLH